jgi:hypothetical protein
MATESAVSTKRPTAHRPKAPVSTQKVVEHDLAKLLEDVRAAIDELAVRGDLATMEGRDLVREQVAEVEARWWDVKKELGLARSDVDATFDTLRTGLNKAEQAVRHVLDAVAAGVRKS